MAGKNEQFADMQRRNLDAAMRLAQLSIENSQRIMELQVETAKSLFEQSVKNAKDLAAVQDPQQALALRGEYARQTTEQMLAAARRVAEITAETQAQFGQMVGQQLAGGGQELMEAWQKMFSFNPSAGAAAQTAMGSLQQAIDMARGAFEQMTQASTQAFSKAAGAAAKPAAPKRGGKG